MPKIEFEYSASGIPIGGESVVSRAGNCEIHSELRDDSNFAVLAEATEAALHDFWTFAVEKQDHADVTDVKLYITNIRIDWGD